MNTPAPGRPCVDASRVYVCNSHVCHSPRATPSSCFTLCMCVCVYIIRILVGRQGAQQNTSSHRAAMLDRLKCVRLAGARSIVTGTGLACPHGINTIWWLLKRVYADARNVRQAATAVAAAYYVPKLCFIVKARHTFVSVQRTFIICFVMRSPHLASVFVFGA